jgi:hypothetical protein
MPAQPLDGNKLRGSPNFRIVVVSALCALAVIFARAWVGHDINSNPVIPYGIFVAYAAYMIKVRRGFGDPAVISLFAFIMYAIPPLFIIDNSSYNVFGFDLEGSYYIYSVASVAIIIATALAFALLPCPEFEVPDPTNGQRREAFNGEALIAAGLSVILSIIFIAQHGIYEGGQLYLGRFSALNIPGTGILFLNSPLATAALCFALVSATRLSIPACVLFAMPYALVFLALGQRKFILLPFLLFVFRFFRVNSIWQLVLVLAIAAAGYVGFEYLGFLRETNIAFSEAFDPRTIALFEEGLPRYLNGEAYGIYVTASSAYSHAVSGSFAHNYLDSFLSLLPQFLFGHQYTSIDGQYVQLVAPDIADLRGGYGYSYFGEAYLVGGNAGIFLATIAMTLFLRCVFVWGGGLQFCGIFGVVSLAMAYHAMWYLRLSFVGFVHEVTIQVAVILIIHAAIRLVSGAKSRPFRLRPPTRF